MKKNTKGAVALGAAALLLAGGAGTYAAWSDEATLGGGEVKSGELRITQIEGGEWAWAGGDEFNPDEDLIVPGDVVEYTGTFEIEMEGTNLVAELTGGFDENMDGDEALVEALTVVATSDIELGEITPSDVEESIDVTFTITFDPDTSGTTAQGESASLADSTLVLTQVMPTGGDDNGDGEGDD